MFKLSRMADYGVVVLSRMARDQGRVVTAYELSERTGLPQPTVAKTLKLLTRGGLLESHRGTQGGYSLDRAPTEVTVSEIIAALEGPVALTACVDGSDENCAVESLCPIRGHWERVNEAVKDALDSVTLADLTASQEEAAINFGRPRDVAVASDA
ncbi:SUF system Fe-S cluster assembly regulator [Marivibrio halodurans]|uniref:SUF system Fe-S cluster assembly regulator n=1 Tax=Marivibrio halodurans TaxID=2039722 RepID=A0A8J7SLL6_9PROT|nr:SUF system Fe-S cluster assembly regulator [Marivibrio halodurans]MBP5856938.1 SUF system Fe-S cluster assembly regulator [Marivibrio halodurans]